MFILPKLPVYVFLGLLTLLYKRQQEKYKFAIIFLFTNLWAEIIHVRTTSSKPDRLRKECLILNCKKYVFFLFWKKINSIDWKHQNAEKTSCNFYVWFSQCYRLSSKITFFLIWLINWWYQILPPFYVKVKIVIHDSEKTQLNSVFLL